jgi:ATP-dependent helicase/nuclease subunit B
MSRVFTIPASRPFLPTLIAALVEGRLVEGYRPGPDPLALASATLYLPTRRACRLARDAFLDVLKTDAVVLPRILAIGDLDEDEISFAEAATGTLAAAALDLPPALGGLARRMLLAKLVLKWAERLRPRGGETPLVVHSPASALGLADDLARLMDDMTTREVSWDRLDGLVPEQVDTYWQLTLDFLKIAREVWPDVLKERNAIEPAQRRDLLINAEAARLAAATHGPVIAAGSTGSMPSTAKLIATIARLPHGAVVLPGLDTDLEEQSWGLIGRHDDDLVPAAGHPQFAMHGLLQRMGVTRAEVSTLEAPALHEREALVSEVLRPADATERWRQRLSAPALAARLATGLAGLSVIEAANAEEEALAIAVVLREAIEQNKTASLVTPDRALARRVIAALGRWNIAADDSGGDALPETVAGVFARLVADVGLGGVAPASLLALLKHPLFRLGAAPGAHARAAAALEHAVLRGPRPRPGTAALAHALASFRTELAKVRRGESSDLHPSDPRCRLADDDLAAAEALIARLAQALEPLERIEPRKETTFSALSACHRAAIERLSDDDGGRVAAYAGPTGEALVFAFDEIAAQSGDPDLAIKPADYADLFNVAIADRVVRRPEQPDGRVRIFGPLEARLTDADRVVLGSLNEGVWPPEPRPDPWLNRPMRLALGLDLPERRIGLSAHDFAQLLGAPEIVLSRAAKLSGAPTVASRFLQRLAAVAGDARWAEVIARGAKYVDWAQSLDRPARVTRIKRPEPKPPRATRPRALSVTEVEHWLRDPYTIYAKHILRLDRLDPVDMPPSAAERGNAIHGAVGEFTQAHARGLPPDPLAELLRIGRLHFAPLDDYPEARAFWWPRFQRIARWFVGWDRERRAAADTIHAETSGWIEIGRGEAAFTLRARADRIERMTDNRYVILDYKTGQVPSDKQVRIGIAPQLTLEAAILRRGGFKGVPAGASVDALAYVKLRGNRIAGEAEPVDLEDRTADAAADHALAKLTALVAKFAQPETPYRSLVLSMWKHRYGTYDDLARVKEWSATGGADEGDEE